MQIKTQVIALLGTLAGAFAIFYWKFGHLDIFIDTAFFFTNGLILLLIGFFVIERHFTKPKDVLVNTIVALIALVSVGDQHYTLMWRILVVYSLHLLILSTIETLLRGRLGDTGPKGRFRRVLWKYCTVMGQARVVFSMVFFYGLIEISRAFPLDSQYLWFVFFWAFILVWEPLGIGQKIESLMALFGSREEQTKLGTIIRAKSPDIVFCELSENVRVRTNDVVRVVLKDRKSKDLFGLVLKVFYLDRMNWANIRILSDLHANQGSLYSKSGEVIAITESELVGLESTLETSVIYQDRCQIVGTVDVNSRINQIKMEITNSEMELSTGRVVYVEHRGKRIFYQINSGVTEEELLEESNRFGFVAAYANQLGIWNDDDLSFVRFDWVPPLNSVVFLYDQNPNMVEVKKRIGDRKFLVGFIPHSDFPVLADIDVLVPHHYSVLGITGCGKTTFEMDLIKKKLACDIKVLCFDITGDYAATFKELQLEYGFFFERGDIENLRPKITELEDERSKFVNQQDRPVMISNEHTIQETISRCVEKMYSSDTCLHIVEIEELANTTDIHDLFHRTLSSLFEYQKGLDDRALISIVFEEAHTIVPERSSATFARQESDKMVNRIAQISLQGRKYGIGFSIITQRTANVAKTILNQCNTVFAFTCYDKTAMDFLANYYGDEYARILPNLGQYQVLAAGKAINSQLPVIAQIPIKTGNDLINVMDARRKLRDASVSEQVDTAEDTPLPPSADDDLPF